MIRTPLTLILGFGLATSQLIPLGRPLRAEEPGLRDQFLKAYPAAVDKWRSVYSHVHGTGTLEEDYRPGGPDALSLSYSFKFWFNADSARFDRVTSKSTDTELNKIGEQISRVINSKEVFAITKSSESSPNKLADIKFKEQEGTALNLKSNQQINFAEQMLIRSSYCVNGMPVDRAIADENFKLKDVRREMREGEELVRIEFDYHLKDVTSPFPEPFLVDANSSIAGWILFAPALQWGIREYEVDSKDFLFPSEAAGKKTRISIRRTGRVTYKPGGTDLPFMDTVYTSIKTADSTVNTTVRFDEIKASESPDELFHLTAFGFPEFDSGAGSPLKLPVVVVFTMGLLALVAAILIRRSGRQN